VQLCDTYSEYIPEVTEHPHDYNTSTENDILDSKPHASANINDPTYPGPNGKMLIYKTNLTLYLAQTKLPKAVYDHVSFASEILTLPPSDLTRQGKSGPLRPRMTKKARKPRTRHGRRIQTAHPRRG
jgi:hypothetical protein